MKNILYVHYGDNWIRGSEACLINLIETLDRSRYTPIIWSNCGPLVEHFSAARDTSYYTPFNLLLGWRIPQFSVVSWFKQLTKAIRLIKQHNIDLIHVNSAAPCQWMCLAAKLCRVPLVTQLHSDYQLRDRFTLGLHLSPRIIGVSYDVCNGLLDDGYPANQLSVIHNGVTQYKRKPKNIREELGIPPSSFVFITVGSLIIRKGVDLIIQALKQTNQNHDCHLVVIGDGEERENLKTLISNLGMQQRVHLVGEQHNVADWLSGGADAFVSGARYEAFGLVLAEAGLAKLPVIAPFVGGIPEFVEHNETGLLFTAENPINDIAFYMAQLIEHPELQKELGSRFYQYCSTHLTVSTNTQRFQRLYEEISNKPSSMPLACSLKPVLRWAFRQ
ncbi:glycosyltransferase [Vibrio gigantis]|uniref:glycosyltransferase n=1 Tax=Vibrio gigantis TaxID=296199 RepID=UPI001EFAFED2|nr:glycosyltransferase [Vibrio gigantis]ULN62871.1 glycosyltransferase [Vibrio gigantis]